MNEGNLMAVILCGGDSRRMGSDKGLLLKAGTPWAQHIASKLDPFQLPVVFSINARQQEAYSVFIPPEQLIPDSLSVPGPLKGLLSVHGRLPSKDLLLLACDMPDLDGSTLSKIIETYRGCGQQEFRLDDDGEEVDFFVYERGEFMQPFCAIYRSHGLTPIYALALKNELSGASLQSSLKKGKTKRIGIDREEVFRNYNSL